MNDFSTEILVDKTPAEVYTAINNVRGWWQGEITGETDKLNTEFTYRMGDMHLSTQKVTELVPEKKVAWLVTESQINFVEDKNEWKNTRISFDITQRNGQTKVTFTHHGLHPEIECYNGCSGAWTALIGKSLLSFIKTGKGIDIF